MQFFSPFSKDNKQEEQNSTSIKNDWRSSLLNKLDEFDSRLQKVTDDPETVSKTSNVIKHLTGLDLSNSYQVKADFIGADLGGANLRNANLEGAKMIGANLTGANLEGANLTNCDLSFAHLEGMKLSGAKINSFFCHDAFLKGLHIRFEELPFLIKAYYIDPPIDSESSKDLVYFAKIMQLNVLDKKIKR